MIYTVAFPKGGTTKTTTAAELIWTLAQRGRRVLAVDLDMQGTLTQRLGFTDATEFNGTAADVLTARMTIEEAATEAPDIEGVEVLVGQHDLSLVDVNSVDDLITSLRYLLPDVADRYDDVVIDTPPAMSDLSITGMAAAEYLIAPVVCDVEAYTQVDYFESVIEKRLAPRINRGLKIGAIIPTRYDGRRLLDRELVLTLREEYGESTKVTDPIREGIAARDATRSAMPVGQYDPKSNPAKDYARVFGSLIGEA